MNLSPAPSLARRQEARNLPLGPSRRVLLVLETCALLTGLLPAAGQSAFARWTAGLCRTETTCSQMDLLLLCALPHPFAPSAVNGPP